MSTANFRFAVRGEVGFIRTSINVLKWRNGCYHIGTEKLGKALHWALKWYGDFMDDK